MAARASNTPTIIPDFNIDTHSDDVEEPIVHCDNGS